MRVKVCLAACVAALTLSVPAVPAIKAMDLKELMSVTSDVIHGTIVSKDSVRKDVPSPGAVWTTLTIEGSSLRTGETRTFEVTFHGSHFEKDWYTVSEMPTLQDTRVGGEVVAFAGNVEVHGGRAVVFNTAGLYRVERGFGEAVVIGKGQGAAFVENTRLTEVATRVAAVHAELEAASSASEQK